jgi:signal peptidase I
MSKDNSSWWDVIKTFAWALVLALIFRSVLYQPFHIPSGSMKPTLEIGDYLIVSKFSYGYSNNSFPLSPNLFEGRKWFTEPERGDIVVFKVPGRSIGEDVFIKRLIGLPGDEIQMINGVLHINGKPVDLVETGDYMDTEKHTVLTRLDETLPNGVKHVVLDEGYSQMIDSTKVYTVPEHHYFMMGDNRDNSTDSRFPTPGFIPQENLIGRAEIILFSFGDSFINPTKWNYHRFFIKLRPQHD